MRRWLFVITIALLPLFLYAQSDSYLYIRRPFQYVGSGVTEHIEVNGIYAGKLPIGKCMRITVPAGSTVVKVFFGLASYDKLKSSGKYLVYTQDIDAGESYYLVVNDAVGTLMQDNKLKEFKDYIAVDLYALSFLFNQEIPDSPEPMASSFAKDVRQDEKNQEPVYKAGDYIPSVEGNLWGFKQYDEWVIKPHYEYASSFSEGKARIKLGGKYGYINKSGENIIPYKFNDAKSFSEGLAAVSLNGKWGYIDENGVLVIPYRYDMAEDFKAGLASVNLRGKKGYVDKDDVWYDTPEARRVSYKGFAKQYVESRINEWQKKGKYEKTEEWKARVTDKNRAEMIDKLVAESKLSYINEQSRTISSTAVITDYDADNEVFLIRDSRFGNLLIPVPLREAEQFENEFHKYDRTNKYYVEGDGIGLAEVVFSKDGKSYSYNNKESLVFSSVDIEYNFESVDFDEELRNEIKGNQSIKIKSEKVLAKADVDVGIPTSDINNDNTFAVIIANENYKREVAVEYAANDGAIFREYCIKTLGIPDKNVRMVADASYLDMKAEVDWIAKVAESYKGDARLLFYYAGHGIPDESSKDAYLLPVDGMGSNPSTGYKLSDLYASLGKFPTKSTVVFLDACFSGAQRSGDMMASARGVAIKAKTATPVGNMVVLSAATGDETAYPYKEKGHGMFTYFLLKKLQQTNGKATLEEIATYVTDEVGKRSIVENAKSQTPTVVSAPGMENEWQTIQLYGAWNEQMPEDF